MLSGIHKCFSNGFLDDILIHNLHDLIRKMHTSESRFGGFEGAICRRFVKFFKFCIFTHAFDAVNAVVAVENRLICHKCHQCQWHFMAETLTFVGDIGENRCDSAAGSAETAATLAKGLPPPLLPIDKINTSLTAKSPRKFREKSCNYSIEQKV